MFREPLTADLLHDGVARDLGGLEDVPYERTRLHRVQLHRQEIRRPQLIAHQVRFNLQTHTHRNGDLYLLDGIIKTVLKLFLKGEKQRNGRKITLFSVDLDSKIRASNSLA